MLPKNIKNNSFRKLFKYTTLRALTTTNKDILGRDMFYPKYGSSHYDPQLYKVINNTDNINNIKVEEIKLTNNFDCENQKWTDCED